MELKLYFQILKRGWWLVVLTALIAFATSLGASFLVTPQYKATARFILSPSVVVADGPNSVLDGLNTLDRQSVIATYAEIMNSNRIYTDALGFMQLQPDDLKDYAYEVVVLPNSSVLELNVTGPDPQVAAKIANALGSQTINFSSHLNQVINIDFLDTAVPPVIPFSPQPLRDAGIATVLGLICGSILAIISEQLRLSFEAFRQRLHYDNETGVYNNKYFSQLVEDELIQHPEDVLTIGIVELDGLRDIVDTFPNVVMQRILQDVTDSLRKELRGNDIIGRWTNLSFIVMLPNTLGMAANRIFERIFQSLSEPVKVNQFNVVVNLDAHIGGAEYGKHISAQELFDKANGALEQARRTNELPVYIWEMKSPFWAKEPDAKEK
jgi:diguanylate cyclase (GGDEF)-like protein